MSKTLTEAALTTRNARAGLAEGVHWRGLSPDVHLGYRKQKRGGRWLVRWYQGDQKYRQATLATADDGKLEADGVTCLTFEQAKTAASRHVSTKRADDLAAADGPAPTVRTAIDAYLVTQEAREVARDGQKASRGDARLRLTRHILSSPLAAKMLHGGWRCAAISLDGPYESKGTRGQEGVTYCCACRDRCHRDNAPRYRRSACRGCAAGALET